MAAYKTSRNSRRDSNRGQRRGGVKGLTKDGSTRAWRRMRESIPGKPHSCPDGSRPFVNHKKPRYQGGKDEPSNLEWRCGHNPYTGRPKGH
jgi:hypothetical protein